MHLPYYSVISLEVLTQEKWKFMFTLAHKVFIVACECIWQNHIPTVEFYSAINRNGLLIQTTNTHKSTGRWQMPDTPAERSQAEKALYYVTPLMRFRKRWNYRGRKEISGCQPWGRRKKGKPQSHRRKFWGVKELFYVLIVTVVKCSCVCHSPLNSVLKRVNLYHNKNDF